MKAVLGNLLSYLLKFAKGLLKRLGKIANRKSFFKLHNKNFS